MGRKKTTWVKVKFPTMPQAALKLGVDKKGRVQQLVTNEVLKNLPDYMPRGTGRLISSMSAISPDRIRVSSVYARFLFFGKTRTGAPVNYSLEKNPKAGPHWDRRMVAERGMAITAKVNRQIKRY